MKDARHDELKNLLVEIRDTQQEHCTRIEGLMREYAADIRQLQTQTQNFVADVHEMHEETTE